MKWSWNPILNIQSNPIPILFFGASDGSVSRLWVASSVLQLCSTPALNVSSDCVFWSSKFMSEKVHCQILKVHCLAAVPEGGVLYCCSQRLGSWQFHVTKLSSQRDFWIWNVQYLNVSIEVHVITSAWSYNLIYTYIYIHSTYTLSYIINLGFVGHEVQIHLFRPSQPLS